MCSWCERNESIKAAFKIFANALKLSKAITSAFDFYVEPKLILEK